jgi:hypothetical protein
MDPIGLPVDFAPNRRFWFQWLTQDTPYLHVVLFGISVIDCVLGQKPFERKTHYHLAKTHAFLRERMTDSNLCLQDSTIFAVVFLVHYFSCLRDYKTAMIHMNGLGKIVNLRGSLESFRSKSRLYIKIARLVICQTSLLLTNKQSDST